MRATAVYPAVYWCEGAAAQVGHRRLGPQDGRHALLQLRLGLHGRAHLPALQVRLGVRHAELPVLLRAAERHCAQRLGLRLGHEQLPVRLEGTLLSSYLLAMQGSTLGVRLQRKRGCKLSRQWKKRGALTQRMGAGATRAAPHHRRQKRSGGCMRRQRHDNGNPQLVAQMARNFKVPDAKAATASNAAQAGTFERFIYLTQARHPCQKKSSSLCAGTVSTMAGYPDPKHGCLRVGLALRVSSWARPHT